MPPSPPTAAGRWWASCAGALAWWRALIGLIDGVTRARAFKQRRRGASAGQLLVALAESMLVGGDAFNDLEDLRADQAGAELRAVPEVPAASTAAQLARRLRPSHLRAAEAALASAGDRLDAELGRDPSEPVTLDFDSTLVEVYGAESPGHRGPTPGQLAYQPLLGVWAERGRVLSQSSFRHRTRPGAMTPSRSCGARWRCFPPATARWGRASTPASTGSSSCGCCAGRGSRSRSRCRAARRCGGRWRGSRRRLGAGDRLSRRRGGRGRLRARGLGARAAAAGGAPGGLRRRGLAADPRAVIGARFPRSSYSLTVPSARTAPAYGYSFCLFRCPGAGAASSTITAPAPRSRSASRTTSWASRCAACRPATSRPTAPGCSASSRRARPPRHAVRPGLRPRPG